jgi:hypothetical protein
MAIVHAHTPEFVAFGMSWVPLWSGESMVPVWDIRQFNKGRSGIVSTSALGHAMAEKLGNSEAVLLWGHGIALTAASIPDVVSRANDLRNGAQLQQAVISMGGTWKPQANTRSTDGASDRTWEYYKQAELKSTGGRVPTSPPPAAAKPSNPDETTARDLVFANRIWRPRNWGSRYLRPCQRAEFAESQQLLRGAWRLGGRGDGRRCRSARHDETRPRHPGTLDR